MKRLGIALIVGLLAASPLPVGGQPNSAAPDQTPKASASNEDKPSSYVPGLGEFMGRIQVDHAKLWLAGEARNWEVFSDVQDLVPRYHNIPVGDMIDAIITGTVTELEGAIAGRDFNKFSASFDSLTAACNSCHQAANRGFIIIRRPAQSNFSNQDFSPAAK